MSSSYIIVVALLLNKKNYRTSSLWSHRRVKSASRLWYDFDLISTFHRLFTDRIRPV